MWARVAHSAANWRSPRVLRGSLDSVRPFLYCGPTRQFSSTPPRIYNSLTNELEPLLLNDEDASKNDSVSLRWYNCGPTVYDSAHLGHARTYVCLDIIRRILEHYFRLDVLYALGLTDIDDKIIRRAGEKSPPVSPLALARRFETEFFEDLALLGVRLPDVVLRVTEHVPDIVKYIEVLEEKGFAYVNSEDKSVYFDVAAFNKGPHSYGTMGPASAKVDVVDELPPNFDEGDEGGLDRSLKRDPRDFGERSRRRGAADPDGEWLCLACRGQWCAATQTRRVCGTRRRHLGRALGSQ